MPYIKPNRRKVLAPALEALIRSIDKTKRGAEINYIICKLVYALYADVYTDLSAAIGDIESAKLEIYRRLLAPMEDRKRKENGEVFGG